MPSVLAVHSVILRETYENLAFPLDRISYKEYEWLICADLKAVALLNGLQTGYAKFCASFANGTVGPDQNITYTQNDHLGQL